MKQLEEELDEHRHTSLMRQVWWASLVCARSDRADPYDCCLFLSSRELQRRFSLELATLPLILATRKWGGGRGRGRVWCSML